MGATEPPREPRAEAAASEQPRQAVPEAAVSEQPAAGALPPQLPTQVAPTPVERPEPKAPAPQPAIDLGQALKESGLQMVETRSDARIQPATEEPVFVPAKRERRPAPPSLDEPLVQVETGRPEHSPPA